MIAFTQFIRPKLCLTTTRKTNGQNPPYGCKKINDSTAASCHMVVTVTPALSMKITLNGYNQFIIKLTNKQRTMISDTSTSSKSTTSATPV